MAGDVKLGLDASQVQAATAQFVSSLQAQGKALSDLVVSFFKVNNAGKATKVVVQEIAASGEIIERTFTRTKNGLKETSTAIRQTTDELRRLQQAQKDLAKTQQLNALLTGVKGLTTQQRPFQIDATAARKVNDLQLLIAKLAQRGGIAADEIKRIHDNIKAGSAQAEAGIRGKIQAALLKLEQQYNVIDAKHKKYADEIKRLQNLQAGKAQLDRLFPVPNTNNVAQLRTYQSAYKQILDLLKTGKVTLDDFQRALNAVNRGSPIKSTDPNQQALITALKQLQQATKTTENAFLGLKDRIIETFKTVAIIQGIRTLINEVKQGAQAAIDFQIRISEIRTLSQENQLGFERWSRSVRELSDEFGRPQADVAKATYEALSNQVAKGAEVIKFQREALQLSIVTTSTATEATNLLASAINAYRLPVTEAHRISSIFFKTIDLGRVTASEMANTFGRIGSLAASLGVSLEETTAAIAALTIQGVKYGDASTLLTNILIKLTKPTDEMKALLESWGTPTGEAAIATFGFAGVLGRLEEATHGSTGELARFFNEIRGLKGAVGLLGNRGLFDNFTNALDKIKGSAQSYENAIQIIEESSGRKLEKEFNKIKNFFVDDFGQSLLNTVADLSEGLAVLTGSGEGLYDVVRRLTLIGRDLTVGYGSYLLVTRSIIIAESIKAAVMTRSAAATAASAAATTSATTAAIGLRTALGPLAFIGGLIASEYFFGAEALGRFDESAKNLTERTKANNPITRLKDESEKFRESLEKSQKSVFGPINQFYAGQLKATQNYLTQIRGNLDEVADAVKVSFGGYIDSLRTKTNDIQKIITETKHQIKDTTKNILGFKSTLDQIIADTQFKFANPEQQFTLTQQRIQKLYQEISVLDNKESRDLAVKKFDEIARLYQELFDKQTQAERANLEAAVAADPRSFGEGPVVQVVSTLGLQSQLNQLLQRRQEFERNTVVLGNQRVTQLEKEKELLKANIKNVEAAAKELFNFSFITKDGNISPQFKNKETGRLDKNKVLAEFDRIVARLTEATAPEDRGLEFFKTIAEQRVAIEKNAQTQITRDALQEQQRRSIQAEKMLKDEVEKSSKVRAEFEQAISPESKIFKDTLEDLKLIDKVLKDTQVSLSNYKKLFSPTETKLEEGSAQERLRAATLLQRTLEQITSIQQRKVTEGVLPSVTELNTLLDTVKQLNAYFLDFTRMRSGTNKDLFLQGTQGAVPGQLLKVTDITDDLERQVRSLLNLKVNADQARINLQDIQADLSNAFGLPLDKIKNQMTSIAEESDESNIRQQTGLEFTQSVIQQTINDYYRLGQAIKDISTPTPTVPGMGGQASGYAKGGYIDGPGLPGGSSYPYFGNPLGTDNIPIWAKRGEMVMNADAVAQFRPMFEAINTGKYKYNPGINHSTRVGDIYINVPAGTPEIQIREIGRQLQSEIRRGNLKL
jgi:TP901 family phage tail tape measure protein